MAIFEERISPDGLDLKKKWSISAA